MISITKANVVVNYTVKPTLTSAETRQRPNHFNFEILKSEVKETHSFASPVHRLGLSRLAETSALHLYALKMSHPTPTEKPSNPANPRVFFDVDIGGERGKGFICFLNEMLASAASRTAR